MVAKRNTSPYQPGRRSRFWLKTPIRSTARLVVGGWTSWHPAIARMAGVDRSFLYRHKDLLAHIHTAEMTPPTADNTVHVTRESLKVDLANAQQRIARLAAHNRQLERKLSELLGEQAWRESGLGAPTDIDQLQRQITFLEQKNVSLARQLEERDLELDAARAANRELICTLNKGSCRTRVARGSDDNQ